MRTLGGVLGAVLLVVACGACSGSDKPAAGLAAGGGPTSTTTSTSSTTGVPASKGTTTSTTTSKTGAKTGTSTADPKPATSPTTSTTSPFKMGPAPDPSKDGTPVPVSIQAPSCVTSGSEMVAKVKSEPDVDMGLIITFSDGRNYDTGSIGTTGPDGTFTKTFAISAEAPEGTAHLYVVVGSGRRGGKADHAFEVHSPVRGC